MAKKEGSKKRRRLFSDGLSRPWRIVRSFLIVLLALTLLIVSIATFVWFFPGTILTSERASKLASLPLTVDFHHPNPRTLGVRIELANGCHSFGDPKTASTICTEEARIEVGVRLAWKPFLQLAWLGPISLRVSRAEIRTASSEENSVPEKEKEPFDPTKIVRYVSPDFEWKEILVDVADLFLVDPNIRGGARIESSVIIDRIETLRIAVRAKSLDEKGSGWTGSFDGTAQREGARLILPRIAGSYRIAGTKPSRIDGEVAAAIDFAKRTAEGHFDARWNHPFAQFRSFQVDAGKFTVFPDGFDIGATIKAVPEGIRPLGRPPIIALRASASMDRKIANRIDFGAMIDEYAFAGMDLKSDLEFSMNPGSTTERFVWKKGMLRVGTNDFATTVRALRKTVFAVPAPFAILKGPIRFETQPFRSAQGELPIAAQLTSNLTSRKQAVATETKIGFVMDANTLAPKLLSIEAKIEKLRLVLPDYELVAPPPMVARDPRIVRPEDQAKKEKEEKKEKEKLESPQPDPESLSVRIAIDSPPGAIQLLNRYVEPEMAGEVHLKIDTDAPEEKPGALMGLIQTSRPFLFHYLNRDISVERIAVGMKPEMEIDVALAMDRAGYQVRADFTQKEGRSRVSLSSVPPLSEDEIVSLILYGVPRSSATADQNSSISNTQAAISSNALGILSFVALASTPVEAIIYDPATKTYSAVVRLPGDLVASIGNSTEDEAQVALSKSLGRNWSISTELIQDPNGVNRAGTMLRWRKRH